MRPLESGTWIFGTATLAAYALAATSKNGATKSLLYNIAAGTGVSAITMYLFSLSEKQREAAATARPPIGTPIVMPFPLPPAAPAVPLGAGAPPRPPPAATPPPAPASATPAAPPTSPTATPSAAPADKTPTPDEAPFLNDAKDLIQKAQAELFNVPLSSLLYYQDQMTRRGFPATAAEINRLIQIYREAGDPPSSPDAYEFAVVRASTPEPSPGSAPKPLADRIRVLLAGQDPAEMERLAAAIQKAFPQSFFSPGIFDLQNRAKLLRNMGR